MSAILWHAYIAIVDSVCVRSGQRVLNMFVIVSSSKGTAPNSITVLQTSASTSHLWRTEDLFLSVFVCPFADWITQVKFPQWLPDDQPTNVATTTTIRTTTTPHRHIFNCGNRNTFAFGELVKLPKILHILGNNKFYSNVCCRVGVPILQCWCVCVCVHVQQQMTFDIARAGGGVKKG